MGASTFKGIVEWEDDLGGEINANSFAITDTYVERLFMRLIQDVAPSTITSIEIKRVNSD